MFTLPVPRVAVPSLNVTVPLTAMPEGGVTVAVKVMADPCVAGLSEETTAVLVAALFTVSVITGEVLPRRLGPPL